MTELTPLARKLRTAYLNPAATADQQDGDEQCWDTDTTSIRDIYVELAKAAADALGVTL